MGFRKVGEKTKVISVEEQFCDICGKTMPNGQYPKLELEIEWKEFRYDGDQAAHFDICSFDCLAKKATALKN